MEKQILRVRINMDRQGLIDLFLDSIGTPNCGNPYCDHKIASVVIGGEPPTWLADDPTNLQNGILTCGRCGNFHGESLFAWQDGEIVEL